MYSITSFWLHNLQVNGVDLSPMSHEEAVMFLRQCGQEVHLRLFRDPAQTPVAALSPTEGHRTFKPILRYPRRQFGLDCIVVVIII